MVTKDIIRKVAEATTNTKQQTEDLYSATISVITQELLAGKQVQLQGLGTLGVKERAERVMVHPRTGERSIVPAKKQLSFKPTTAIKEELK